MASLKANVASLFLVQLANYAMPLITLPWLTRTLGPDGFGRLSFCTAINAYLVLLCDFGFNLSATRDIAVHSHDKVERSRIFWTTLTAKASLAVLGFGVLQLLVHWVDSLAAERDLLLVGYIAVVGSVLTPTWYFQGTERLPVLSGITIALRAVSVPLTLIWVTTRQDVVTAMAISAAPATLTGMLCLGVLFRERSIVPAAVSVRGTVRALKGAWHLFLSNAAISLYTTTNTVLLGVVAGSVAVGYYSAAEKLIKAAQGLVNPLSQSFYPRVSRLMQESHEEAFKLLRRLLRLQGGYAFMISLVIFCFAPYITHLLYGQAYETTTDVLRWLSPLPFVIALSNVFGIQTMLPLGMNRTFSHIVLAAGALNVVALYVLASWFGAVGAAEAVLFAEVAVTVTMAVVLHGKDIPIFEPRRVS